MQPVNQTASCFNPQDIQSISRRIFSRFHIDFPYPLQAAAGDGLEICWQGGEAQILAMDKTALARGCFLLAQAVKAGKKELHIRQQRHIRDCGAFIDCSRGAVMTVQACKRYIDCLAALGMNLFILYMEDTFTVPEYPYFGHLRGRYSKEELREIDDYAHSMGVELVPCIQTLAHLSQFLQWQSSAPLKDTPDCMLIDEEETYTFIEAEIRAIRDCVRSRRLHIGMDEAHGVGLGRYYAKHGPVNRFELLMRHLNRVEKICRQYDFYPLMWSDMFFRLGSQTNAYYDMDVTIPESVIQSIPQVGVVYWDYYHAKEEIYEHFLAEHEKLGPPLFAGGVWTWSGFLPHVSLTDETMYPALRCCARHGVQMVAATMWGDDGNETNAFLALHQLPIFSEFCWIGEKCTKADVIPMSEALTGLPYEAYQAFEYFYAAPEEDFTGKGLIYCDLLYPLLPNQPDLAALMARYAKGREILSSYLSDPRCRYGDILFAIVQEKARAILDIRRAYQEGDKEGLLYWAEKGIPALHALYDQLEEIHRDQWEQCYKRCGWEIFPLRYGAVRGRLMDAARALARYARGEMDTLEELDAPLLDARRHSNMQWYPVYVSPIRE